jgi:hypothetical protein
MISGLPRHEWIVMNELTDVIVLYEMSQIKG